MKILFVTTYYITNTHNRRLHEKIKGREPREEKEEELRTKLQ